jgi:hypothetical protein
MRFFSFLFFCSTFLAASAQDPVAEKMSWYGKAAPTSNLFVHFDKNVYSNNETAWFTAYLIKEGSIKSSQHKILAIALIRNIDTLVITTKKFIMVGGIATGNFEMPDSVQTGNYRLLAYTDKLVNGLPEAIFIQQITLKTSIDPSFKSSMKLIDQIKPADKFYKVLIAATTADNRFLPKPLTVNYRYGKTVKKGKTDASGQLLMTLPIQNNNADPHLYVKLSGSKDSTFMQMPLPYLQHQAHVNFFPEGGHSVLGITTLIGFEVRDQQRMPMAVKAQLYKNEQVIDTVETDPYGLGKFRLNYEKDAHYTLKLIHNGVKDSTYQLPKPLVQGITLHIANAVVDDTLRLKIATTGSRQIHIRIHNFTKSFLREPYTMERNYQSFKVPLANMPKGLLAITVSDSLDRPIAERLFFAHYNNQQILQVNTDRQVYGQREKVNLSFNLPDSTARGLVSIAVVQNNRLELKKMTDIESYSYLSNVLADLPTHLKGLPFKDSKHIENVLLIKGWRRYTWEGLNKLTVTDTAKKYDSIGFTAQVLKYNKQLKAPVMLAVIGDSKFRVGTTSNNGFLNLNKETYIANGRGKLFLFINDNSKLIYDVNISDGFIPMSEKIKKTVFMEEIILPSTIVNNADLVLKGNEKAIRLKEVVIKSNADNSFKGTTNLGSNACGDYICSYNIFNCPNHPFDPANRPPVKGQTYKRLAGPYAGCVSDKLEDGYFSFNYIRYAKEFYENDYQDPQEPAFFSTLYWNYGKTLKGKTANLSFYTSDITGKFRVVVQGILNQDVVYAEHLFEVKGK